MLSPEHLSLHALRSLPAIGDKSLRALITSFGSAEAAWQATVLPQDLRLSRAARESFLLRHTHIPDRERLGAALSAQNISIVTCQDLSFPPLLRETPDHPYFLYIRGNFDFTRPCFFLAVVGSRKTSSYGRQVAESIVRDLSRAGIVIVSGLAFGIDQVAHESTLRSDGRTLAVLGSGVDDAGITPSTHQPLGQKILEAGALISEFPPGIPPLPGNFPMRNRIIAGMTLGTLVIEAAEKSGSLITAHLALDYNREVFAIPGSIFSPLSQGTHALIKQGAKLVTSVEDILETFSLVSHQHGSDSRGSDVRPLPVLSAAEKTLFTLLADEPVHIDLLIQKSTLPAHEVSSTLTILEVKKLIKNIGNKVYIRSL
jgi:DNA processing protein